MADIRVELITDDPGLNERITRSGGNVQVERNYRVFTHVLGLAAYAPGLPKEGDSYGPEIPLATVREIGLNYEWGRTEEATGRVGCCIARVRYASGGRLQPVPPIAGAKYREWIPQRGTQDALWGVDDFDANGNPIAGAVPANNGRGMPVEVSTYMLRVIKFYRDMPENFEALNVFLNNSVNRNSVIAPPLLGRGPTMEFMPGELLMLPPRIGMEGELYKVEMEMLAAPDHRFYWIVEDKDGHATTEKKDKRRYFAEVWPPEWF